MKERQVYGTMLIVSLLFFGCATAYQPKGWRGGYEDQQLTADTYLVTFSSNMYTSTQTVQEYLLYRCAELTVEKGGDHFLQIDETTDLRNTQYDSVPVFGNSAPSKPQIRTKIQILKGQPPADGRKWYNARELLQYLGPKVNPS